MPKLFGFARVSLPGPAPVPLLGHLPRLLRFLRDPVTVIERLRPYGDVVALARDNPAMVCVFGPERNREVLTNPDGFRHDEDFIDGPEGSSMARMRQVIININGEQHRRHRRLMAPAFSRAALQAYAAPTVALTEAAVAGWPRDTVVELAGLVREVSLRVALRNLYGLDVGSDATSLSELAVSFIDVLTHPLTLMLRRDIPGTPFHHAMRRGQQVLDRLETIVADKRARAQGAPGQDALAHLIAAADDDADGFSDDELMCETVTLLVAGYETTAHTLVWTLFLLERHPAVLADVLDELDATVGDRPVTLDDLPALVLLDRVIKESMRVLTVTPTVFLRVPHQDTPLGRYTVPQGANVLVSPYATHHDPALYSEPHAFRPERWEGEGKRSVFEYLPFGAGPRVCLGAALAQQTLRLMLTTILQRVRMSIVEGARIDRRIRANIMRPKHGLPVRLEDPHRERRSPAPIEGNVREMVALA